MRPIRSLDVIRNLAPRHLVPTLLKLVRRHDLRISAIVPELIDEGVDLSDLQLETRRIVRHHAVKRHLGVSAFRTKVIAQQLEILRAVEVLARADDLRAAGCIEQGFDKGARVALDVDPWRVN